MVQKIMYFYLNTGSGHYSSAKSLASYLSSHYDTENILIDGLKNAPKSLKVIVEDGCQYTLNKAKIIYKGAYAFHEKSSVVRKSTFQIIDLAVWNYIRKVLIENRPDKIIITHPLLIKAVEEILDELNIDIPSFIFVLDPFTASELWYCGKRSQYIVFSDESLSKVIEKGIPSQNCHMHSFALREEFSENSIDEVDDDLKIKYNVDPSDNVLLIIGGGAGMPNGGRILKHLCKDPSPNLQIIFVAGNNKQQFSRIKKMIFSNPSVKIQLYGFTDRVKDLMSISDFIITKAGPATLFEILLLGKIPFSHKYIWGQEKGNVDFIMNEKIGFYIPQVKKLVDQINYCNTHPEIIEEYKERLNNLNLVNGTPKLAEFIYEYRD